jgi:hypothetical protein
VEYVATPTEGTPEPDFVDVVSFLPLVPEASARFVLPPAPITVAP